MGVDAEIISYLFVYSHGLTKQGAIMGKDTNETVVRKSIFRSRESKILALDLDIKLVEHLIAFATSDLPDGAIVIESVRENLNLLRHSCLQFMAGNMKRSDLDKVLKGVRHAVLSMTEQALSKSESWSTLRRDLLRSFGKNGIEAEISKFDKNESEVGHE
ncbi:MAG: hypothetical protein ABTQ25_14005 [Nitrosomonas ureae]